MLSSTEAAIPPCSSSPAVLPLTDTTSAPVIVTEPGRLGQFTAMVSQAFPALGIAYRRCLNDRFAHGVGCFVGYGLGLVFTGAGLACGALIGPPLFVMAAVPGALTLCLGTTHLGCCVHHYRQARADLDNAMAATTDESYLVVPPDIVEHLETKGIDLEETDSAAKKESVMIEMS